MALIHVNFAVVPSVPWLAATPVVVDTRGRTRTMGATRLAQTLVDIVVARVACPSRRTYATEVRRFLSAVVTRVLMSKRVGTLLATPVSVALRG